MKAVAPDTRKLIAETSPRDEQLPDLRKKKKQSMKMAQNVNPRVTTVTAPGNMELGINREDVISQEKSELEAT